MTTVNKLTPRKHLLDFLHCKIGEEEGHDVFLNTVGEPGHEGFDT